MVLMNGQNLNKITLSPKTPTIMKKPSSVIKKPADSTTGLVKKTVLTKPCVRPLASIKPSFKLEISSEKAMKIPITSTKTLISKSSGLTSPKIIKKSATPVTPASSTSKTLFREKTPKPSIKPVSKSSLDVKPTTSVKSTTKTEISKSSPTGKTLPPLKSSVRQISSPVKSTSSSLKASSPTILLSPLKSSPSKPTALSSPSRPALSKLSASPKLSSRAMLSRDIKPLPKEKTLSPSTKEIKSTTIIPKSPSKQTSARSVATSLSKPIKLPKTVVSNRVSKTGIKLKLDIFKAQEYNARNFEKPTPEPDKPDLCQCIEPYSNIPVDSKTPDANFNVVQAYKLAEQLIRIQEDENLTMSWPLEDPVLDPTSGFIDEIPTSWNPKEIFSSESCTEPENSDILQVTEILESSVDIIRTSPDVCEAESVFDNLVTGDVTELADCESTEIIDFTKSVADSTSDLENEKKFGYESNLQVTPIKCESLCFSYVKISDNEKQYIECQSTTEQGKEYVTSCLTDAREKKIENHVGCRSTIQELEKVNKSPLQITPAQSVCLTYADILKKAPTVLTNATNLTPKEPVTPLVNLQKQYQMLKKVENLYATNIFFPKIDSDVDSTIYDGEYDEIEYALFRKKNCKKIKHFSKRYLKNIRRDFENFEDTRDYTNVFITPVWKNIY